MASDADGGAMLHGRATATLMTMFALGGCDGAASHHLSSSPNDLQGRVAHVCGYNRDDLTLFGQAGTGLIEWVSPSGTRIAYFADTESVECEPNGEMHNVSP
jgi:hypothetical protein